MDLKFINECALESSTSVIDVLDSIYIKQQQIMEFADDVDLSKYQCFQEGFAKPVASPELNVFKFENDHILKAIKFFNEAYEEIPFDDTNFDEVKQKQEKGELNIKNTLTPEIDYPAELIQKAEACFRNSSGPLEKGIQELQKQFDCKFKVFISRKQGTGTFIEKFSDNPGKLTISKSKGFQLGGLNININLNVSQLLSFAPANRKLFGQSLTSVLLHEIYHNIVHMIDVRNHRLHDDIKKTIKSAGDAKNNISVESGLSSFIERFMNIFNLKRNDVDKERAINRLYVLSKIQDNPAAMKKFQDDIKHDRDNTNNDREIEDYIEKMQTITNVLKIGKVAKMVSVACSILLASVGFVFGNTLAIAVGAIYLTIMSLGMLMKKVSSLLGVTPFVREEYFCDLFAAMYKLPIHMSSFNRQIMLNKTNGNKMTKLRKMDQKIDKLTKDVHPLTFDREVTSYKLAKQILNSDEKLSTEVKDYLQYIVDLHDGIDKIDNPKSKRQAKKLDPEAAADLQKTLNEFIAKTGATVTESFIIDMCNINGGEYYGVG